jgi:hypothetical protein
MGALKKTKNIVEDETVLRINSRKYGSHAKGTKNIQTGQFVVLIHFAFGYSDIGPFERDTGLDAAVGANESDPGLIEQGVTSYVV